MKNIYLLPTQKQTKLRYFNGVLELAKACDTSAYHALYITSLEVKDDDITNHYCMFLSSNGMVQCLAGKGRGYVKTPGKYFKIVSTTDEDLIQAGVPNIDDLFLEWLVVKYEIIKR